MEITRCNNYDLYNGACGMFCSTGMIIHINAIINCVGLNAFCTHLIPENETMHMHTHTHVHTRIIIIIYTCTSNFPVLSRQHADYIEDGPVALSVLVMCQWT